MNRKNEYSLLLIFFSNDSCVCSDIVRSDIALDKQKGCKLASHPDMMLELQREKAAQMQQVLLKEQLSNHYSDVTITGRRSQQHGECVIEHKVYNTATGNKKLCSFALFNACVWVTLIKPVPACATRLNWDFFALGYLSWSWLRCCVCFVMQLCLLQSAIC